MKALGWLVCGVVLGGAVSCTAAAKKDAAKTALDAMSDEDRRETWEATARILDRRPEWVDELYTTLRKSHDPTMRRFLENTTRDLHEQGLAKATAQLLVQYPDSLQTTLELTTDSVVDHPDARQAMNRAMTSRAAEMVDVMTDEPKTVSTMVKELLVSVEKKPSARRGAIVAVRDHRSRIVALITQDGDLTKAVAKQLLHAAVKDDPGLEKVLRKAKLID